jgi:peptidoglycan hydrolase-like protein with peptidoglycan-binding domain
MWRFEVAAECAENYGVQRTTSSPTRSTDRSTLRPQLRRRGVRAACAVTFVGLTFSTVPTTVSATPAPAYLSGALVQSVVGLGEGTSGDSVRRLQNALMAAGVPVPGGADGIFGPKTKSAVIAYQSRQGLPATGAIDEATARALGLAEASSSPSSSPASGAVLSLGARGDAVKELQQALISVGVYVAGGADGIFGPATRTAVTNFQRWNGLTVSGDVDAATASRLKLGTGSNSAGSTSGAGASSGGDVGSSTFVGMKLGARGDNVKVLQQALINARIAVRGGADGWFGPATQAALISYQQANGLATDGVVSSAVVSRLALTAGSAPAAPAPPASLAPSPSAPYVGLTVGARGDRVKDLQRALMNTGLTLRGGADGVFGNVTKAALIAFQRTAGTTQNGIVAQRDATVLGLGTNVAPPPVTQSGFPVFGERGDRVRTLQQSLLNARISFAGGADGVFGSATSGAILTFQRREGLPATGRVDQATADRLGAVAAPAPRPPSSSGVTMDVFPVQGRCWYGDTWLAPRSGGRLHQGVDIIAPTGKLLYAVVSGTISRIYIDTPGALAGNGLRVAQDDGTYFTYLHLDRFAEGIKVGTRVTAGQVIGYVGNTGASATPHLHFEVHPGGGAAVNPYPLVKRIDACQVTTPRS